jgi:hypothetical protein
MPLYTFIHNLLNVLVQIANRMGLQTNKSQQSPSWYCCQVPWQPCFRRALPILCAVPPSAVAVHRSIILCDASFLHASRLANFPIMKMATIFSFEKSVKFYWTSSSFIPEADSSHGHYCECGPQIQQDKCILVSQD